MRILVLGLNYAPEPVGIATYTTGLAEALATRGHDVVVVAGKPYYPQWRVPDAYRGPGWSSTKANGVEIIRCPHYVPANPSGAKRIVHHVSFALSSLGPMVMQAARFRPDIVLTIAPSLIAAPVARLAAALCRARSWLHIQDFEIEAAFATGLMGENGMIGEAALGFQRSTIKGFDICSSISPQMCAKLRALGVPDERVVEFRNWADLSRVHVLDRPSTYRAEWGITAPHVALYSGNIANKQGIGVIVEAARRLVHRPDILFLVCGEGPQREQLVADAKDLPNMRFEALQPVERLGELVGLASVHLLPQLAGAADLVLPSKLTNMLASGRPVIATAEPGTGLAGEVEGCGIITPPGDADRFAAAIEALVDDPAGRAAYGAAARRRAEERWSQDAIIGRLDARLHALAGVVAPTAEQPAHSSTDMTRVA